MGGRRKTLWWDCQDSQRLVSGSLVGTSMWMKRLGGVCFTTLLKLKRILRTSPSLSGWMEVHSYPLLSCLLLAFLPSSCIWSFLLQYECYHCYSKATIWTVSHEQMHVINVCDILWWNVFSCLISKNFRAVWPCFFNLNLVLKIIFLSSKIKTVFECL